MHTEASCGWGGQELRIVADVVASQQRGHTVCVVVDPSALFLSRARLEPECIATARLRRKGLTGLITLGRVIRAFSPDVIVTHSSTDHWLVSVIRVLSFARFSIVRLRHISAPIQSTIPTRWVYRQAQSIVTTSDAIRDQIRMLTGLSSDRITAIATGVDCSLFKPVGRSQRVAMRTRLGLPEDAFVLCAVSTLRSWKGHRFVLQALVELKDVIFVVAGDGPQEEALRAMTLALELDHRVIFLGYQADVRAVFEASDCFVQASTGNEGVSQSMLQAMASGLPVVVSNIGGLNEVVRHEVEGLLVEPTDVLELVNALARMQSQSTDRIVFGQAARRRVTEHYSLEAMADSMEQVIRSAVSA